MPLEEELLIACSHNVVELTATVVDPRRDHPEVFRENIEERLLEHRRQAMGDPTLVDSDGLGISSIVLSRDPLPDALREVLTSLGFVPEETESGGRARTGLLSFLSQRRSKLDRWRLTYARARDISPALGTFEQACVESVPEPPFWNLAPATDALKESVRAAYGLSLDDSPESLVSLEKALAFRASDLLMLHPSAVRGLAAFVVNVLESLIPDLRYDPEAEWPVLIPTKGSPISSDPEFRVVEHVRIGPRASLSRYVRQLEADHRSILST